MIFLYADPDATGTGDGLSWLNAKTTLQGAYDLIPASLTDDYTILIRSSSGTAFTNVLDMSSRTMNGFTTTLQAETGDEALKSGWDVTRARLELNGAGIPLISVNCPSVTIKGLQIYNTVSGADIILYSTDTLIDGVRLRTTGADNGISCNTASVTAKIQNSIIYHFSGSTPGSEGVYVGSGASGSIELYNSIVYGYDDGIEDDSPADIVTCVNLAVINNVAQDFDTVANVDHCLSDDGTGTNAQTPLGANHLNEFVDPANEDFTAVETGNIQFGVGVSVNANVPALDIEGDTRSGASAYIGVDEPAGGVTPASPNDIVLSAIVLESTTANNTAIPSNLILSAIILESTVASSIATPSNLILSSIVLESVSGRAVRLGVPDNLILSGIILEQATGRKVGAAKPLSLELSAIILGQTRQSGGVAIPACITINMDTATTTIEPKTAEITIIMEVC